MCFGRFPQFWKKKDHYKKRASCFDKKKQLVVSIDTYNEGVHFPNFKHPNLVIKKVLRASISDLISKGVKPEYYFISGSGNKKNFTKKKS